ncbi:hypothetical protein FFLO_05868 [Filobasidium floriforme]|uniref:Uncharacterized protein n=1 Tax=Filobasidium floriforme TaxID=5210 RepID=A0A8K0JIB9_9TREE|nr:uncharacterized protein HD553DRAFT_325230 [Filobasidium floriforme]KAG7528969.1 hypothetical protein FFLO_05868 [Filobasidium floriforme]KAH8081747.1 hypothetical protein HD553DRAFT_325230 [Filobasidium floriforme]
MTHANTRTISRISRESYGTEDYEGPYLLNHTDKDLSEGGSTIMLVSSMPDREQDQTSSIEDSRTLRSRISISDDGRGDIEIKSTYTRESTQTALFMASLHERDKQRKARLGRCYDAMSRREREEHARRFSLQQLVYRYYVALLEKDDSNDSVKRKHTASGHDPDSSELRQELLIKAVSKAERELPQAGKVDDSMKASVAKLMIQRALRYEMKIWNDARHSDGAADWIYLLHHYTSTHKHNIMTETTFVPSSRSYWTLKSLNVADEDRMETLPVTTGSEYTYKLTMLPKKSGFYIETDIVPLDDDFVQVTVDGHDMTIDSDFSVPETQNVITSVLLKEIALRSDLSDWLVGASELLADKSPEKDRIEKQEQIEKMLEVYHRLQNENDGKLNKNEAACWIFDPEYWQYLWTEEDRLRLREKVDGVCRILTDVQKIDLVAAQIIGQTLHQARGPEIWAVAIQVMQEARDRRDRKESAQAYKA